MNTTEIKGVVIDKTYVILNGTSAIGSVDHYTEVVKDEFGKKHRIKHAYFNIAFADSIIRFERLRGSKSLKPHKDISETHTLVVYADEELAKVRDKIIVALKRK